MGEAGARRTFDPGTRTIRRTGPTGTPSGTLAYNRCCSSMSPMSSMAFMGDLSVTAGRFEPLIIASFRGPTLPVPATKSNLAKLNGDDARLPPQRRFDALSADLPRCQPLLDCSRCDLSAPSGRRFAVTLPSWPWTRQPDVRRGDVVRQPAGWPRCARRQERRPGAELARLCSKTDAYEPVRKRCNSACLARAAFA